MNTIGFEHTDLDSVDYCKTELKAKIQAILADLLITITPFRNPLCSGPRKRARPEAQSMAALIQLVQSMERRLESTLDRISLQSPNTVTRDSVSRLVNEISAERVIDEVVRSLMGKGFDPTSEAINIIAGDYLGVFRA
jgi:hypothetical protein